MERILSVIFFPDEFGMMIYFLMIYFLMISHDFGFCARERSQQGTHEHVVRPICAGSYLLLRLVALHKPNA